MKTVLLFRHGKSDWDADYGADHDRPLTKRGKAAARLIGLFLTSLQQVPDRIYTSSAVRASESIRRAARAGDWSCPIQVSEELYRAAPEQVLDLIRESEEAADRILLAGHEPTWSLLTGGLIGEANLKFPTAAIARIDLAVESWRETEFGKGILVWLVNPKLLAGIGWPDGLR
jgi:phosphohistidine phosphatase